MKRQAGFYWVKFQSEWEIAEYLNIDCWRRFSLSRYYADHHFTEIDERRIVRDEPDGIYFGEKIKDVLARGLKMSDGKINASEQGTTFTDRLNAERADKMAEYIDPHPEHQMD